MRIPLHGDANDFYTWVDFFDRDDRARIALPMLMASEIQGMGFALACDFLKELGYTNFAKPDVHLNYIFDKLGLCELGANDYGVFKAIVRVANNANVTPYAADKVFWLIGSGDFYDDQLDIGRHREKFVAYAKKNLTWPAEYL